jgi:hypothetical protein
MTRQVLMILPSTEDEKPRMVGPFLTEATANAWADSKEIDSMRRVIRPLESPASIYSYGRHALIPSPSSRKVGGRQFIEGPRVSAPNANPTLRIDAEREPPPPYAPSLTGGIRHWITGEALALAPWNVMGDAEATANWSGPIARFNHPATDGRTLELNGAGAGDWISHFTRVPVGVWVMAPKVGALPIGLCERVRVEEGWLIAEGRISLGHFQKATPELFADAMPSWKSGVYTADMEEKPIPAAIDVTNGVHGGTVGALTITGPWELERVVFGSVPAWPGCSVRLGELQLEPHRG